MFPFKNLSDFKPRENVKCVWSLLEEVINGSF